MVYKPLEQCGANVGLNLQYFLICQIRMVYGLFVYHSQSMVYKPWYTICIPYFQSCIPYVYHSHTLQQEWYTNWVYTILYTILNQSGPWTFYACF